VLAIAAAIIGSAIESALSPNARSGPPARGVLFALGGICLLAGLLDLKFIFRGKLSARQGVSRHVWRMCFAFFVATGSFFLGQQKIMPQAVRGSPILFVLAFAPIAPMVFWLVRVWLSRMINGLQLADAAASAEALVPRASAKHNNR
jgi:hypothetical protein